MKTKYRLAKFICKALPPIMAQSVRNKLISIQEGEHLHLDFKKRSITGAIFVGNTSDFHAFKFSVHGYFDWRNVIISRVVLAYKKGGDIIEVGANIGTETISFCDIARRYHSKVYAFEPLPKNLEVLNENKQLNQMDHLVIYNRLVSDKSGTAFFNVPQGNNSGSGFILDSKSNDNVVEFDVVTLDDTFKDNNLALLCVDVEGFEYHVLKGGENVIKRHSPVLILEVNRKYLETRGQVRFDEFCNYLVSLGYECYSITKLGIIKVNFEDLKHQSNKNWVCVHKNDQSLISRIGASIFINAINPLI